jgi:Uma2 family endonuclease
MVASLKDLPHRRYTLEEYFALESVGAARYEYWNGDILCMSGGTPQHATISVNITSGLKVRLRGGRCRDFNADMAIKTLLIPPYRYPDASVVCGEPIFEKVDKFDTLANPTLIVEVLSPSTLNLDKTLKRDAYQAIPSLQEYLLIAQDAPRITHYVRQGNQWLQQDYSGLTITLELPALGCQLPLSEIYEDVRFD